MPPRPQDRKFHGRIHDASQGIGDGPSSFLFSLHEHSHTQVLVARLIQGSIQGLQSADTEPPKKGGPPAIFRREVFTQEQYDPVFMVEEPHPVEDLDFSASGAYSVYDWELFFHVPLTIAIHLSRNQRFAEAQQWFHYIFDPTDDSSGATPVRYWGVRPFKKTDVVMVEETLVNLVTGEDPKLQDETINLIKAWMDDPFRPHLVARYRPSSYMLKTLMAYLDNLIDWGDALFRQDTRESINEATQLYVLASNLLGPRPQAVPSRGEASPQTYAKLRGTLDLLGNALVDLEASFPFDATPPPKRGSMRDKRQRRLDALQSVALYFCIPRNDQLLAYWDTVADRLFKIRNSLNIHGIFRQLALFEPPIDPGLLAKAVAAGVDVGAVVSGMNQPLPLVRFWVLVRQAAEICQEVRSLGANLLGTMEKEDNEALAVLRARHERVILALVESVRYAQWQQAIKTREGVERSIEVAAERYTYYQRLLGKEGADLTIPQLEVLEVGRLLGMSFQAEEPVVAVSEIEVTIADEEPLHKGKALSEYESQELTKLRDARNKQVEATSYDQMGSEMAIIPDFTLNLQPIGIGTSTSVGGSLISKVMAFKASTPRAMADSFTYEASMAAKVGSYERREQEWTFQGNLAAREISQQLKQLRAAQIGEAVAKREWDNHKRQIEHAEEIEEFLTNEKNGKKTNQAFYAWMKREVRGLYAQCFQLALDAAKKAERALGHELGDPQTSFISTGYMAGNEGLFAGEKLYLDIKRMELAYHELNRREYEITKHISLRQVDPGALMSLRATGKCTFDLPEALFDLDGPGHYFRRIRSVSVTIPAVTGPYTNVNCTLTLLKSEIRKTPLLRDDADDEDHKYARAGVEDERFSDNWSSLQSVVTSGAERDPGLFEMNLRDERYLPFEGSGVISTWQLELPSEIRKFDYDTITDVVLHMLYTAREGGGQLRSGAVEHLEARIREGQTVGSVQLLSVRHEFPLAWQQFKAAELEGADALADLQLELRREHYPFWSQKREMELQRLDLYASPGEGTIEVIYTEDGESNTATLTQDSEMDGLRVGALTPGEGGEAPMPPAIGEFMLQLSGNTMDDVWIAVTWGWRAEGS